MLNDGQACNRPASGGGLATCIRKSVWVYRRACASSSASRASRSSSMSPVGWKPAGRRILRCAVSASRRAVPATLDSRDQSSRSGTAGSGTWPDRFEPARLRRRPPAEILWRIALQQLRSSERGTIICTVRRKYSLVICEHQDEQGPRPDGHPTSTLSFIIKQNCPHGHTRMEGSFDSLKSTFCTLGPSALIAMHNQKHVYQLLDLICSPFSTQKKPTPDRMSKRPGAELLWKAARLACQQRSLGRGSSRRYCGRLARPSGRLAGT